MTARRPLTVKAVARRIGVTPRRLRELMREQGKGVGQGRAYYLTEKDVPRLRRMAKEERHG